MKRLLLLTGLVVLWFSLSAPVAAQEEEIPYWGYQWGYPFEVDQSWQPLFVEPVRPYELWGTIGPDVAQPVFMGYPSGDGFREVELLGYQDQIMWIQQGSPHFQNGWPAMIVSPPMWDHEGRVQFVIVDYWVFNREDEHWPGGWAVEGPPSHLVIGQGQLPTTWEKRPPSS